MKRLLLMPLVLFWACDDKLETNDYRYPLDIGNKWIYSWKVNMFEGSSVDSFSVDSLILIDSLSCTRHASVDSIVSLNNMSYYSLSFVDSCTEDSGENYYNSINYLEQNEHGLFSVANSGESHLPAIPKSLKNSYLVLPLGEYFQNYFVLSDSIIFHSNSEQILKYPLFIGQSWSLIENFLTKTITGEDWYNYGDISTNGYRIEYTGELANDLDMYDIVGEKGLLYMYRNYGYARLSDSDGTLINIYHSTAELKLIEINF